MKKLEVLIIGGGAAGLMAGIAASAQGASVRILEKNDRVGRKILATGNGRCNFTNSDCAASDFMGSTPEFIGAALDSFGVGETLTTFETLGILPREESEGRVYPYSEQAASVLDALISELSRLKAEILLNSEVKTVKKSEDGFIVILSGGKQYKADRVIITTGGKAGSQYGCQGDGYALAKALGHRMVDPRPALVQMTSDADFFRQLKGVRSKGKVSLYRDLSQRSSQSNRPIAVETGEIQFTDTGLSGICIFNLSRYIADIAEPVVVIDLIPEMTYEALREKLMQRLSHFRHKDLDEFLNGVINKRLIPVLLKASKLAGNHKLCATLDETDMDKLAGILKSWPVSISGTKGFQDAQTTAGGVDTKEIAVSSLESTLVKGLYFAGEVLDIDGPCGGYNLQWAWTSGYLAGKAAGREANEKSC